MNGKFFFVCKGRCIQSIEAVTMNQRIDEAEVLVVSMAGERTAKTLGVI